MGAFFYGSVMEPEYESLVVHVVNPDRGILGEVLSKVGNKDVQALLGEEITLAPQFVQYALV